MKRAVQLMLIGGLVLAASVAWGQWNLQTIDDSGNAGYSSNVAFDGNGFPHVVYLSKVGYTSEVQYTYWTGTSWGAISTLSSLDETDEDDEIFNADIFIDPTSDLPVVAVSYKYQGTYYYHRVIYMEMASDGSWTYTTIYNERDSYERITDTWECSVTIDPNLSNSDHTVHLLFESFDGIIHERFDTETQSWVQTQVDGSGNVGQSLDSAIDSQGRLHVAYYDELDEGLKYALFDDMAWTADQYVETPGALDLGSSCSITVDSSDNPHIAYYDATNGDLYHTTATVP